MEGQTITIRKFLDQFAVVEGTIFNIGHESASVDLNGTFRWSDEGDWVSLVRKGCGCEIHLKKSALCNIVLGSTQTGFGGNPFMDVVDEEGRRILRVYLHTPEAQKVVQALREKMGNPESIAIKH
ncbi:MAG: hypothetical protein KJ970_15035 [Candidatus Eisenbacteria bacterium]|uniref:Uncharacterized protein n=1 Tax=Eiseniibacteriota bacterium TaxID=2212470 RepID=A0A948RWP0_UNCEI|nr:hypothetical protein [Candidatus Eisenbacteria bacterium]MBU1948342.1 hypothetical protein [Candidatus Eisenbacteria bacterium]MBU2692235.1 hypothetical protein [Candidatus Eisenbacteria bacterium]